MLATDIELILDIESYAFKLLLSKKGSNIFKKKLLLAALFTAAAQTGFAADQSSAMYILGSIGQSKVSIDKASFDNDLTTAGATGLSSTTDEKDTGYKLQLGYQYNQSFAIEGGYVDLGKFKYNATYTGGAASAEVKAKGWNIDAVGIAPLNDAFSLLGKIGLIRGKVDTTVSATGPGGAASESVSASKVENHLWHWRFLQCV
jgi:hypothetical protein